MNAHFLGDRIATFEKVHLGVAVDTPKGLLVPVVREAPNFPSNPCLPQSRKWPLPVVRVPLIQMI